MVKVLKSCNCYKYDGKTFYGLSVIRKCPSGVNPTSPVNSHNTTCRYTGTHADCVVKLKAEQFNRLVGNGITTEKYKKFPAISFK